MIVVFWIIIALITVLFLIRIISVLEAYKTFRSTREAEFYNRYDKLNFKQFLKIYKKQYTRCKDFTYDKNKGIHLYTVRNGMERMACSEDRVTVDRCFYIFFNFPSYWRYYNWLKREIKRYAWKERKQTLEKREKGLFKDYLQD